MKLLNTLRLLVASVAPTTGVSPGAVYYDAGANEPRYNDGANWNAFGQVGFPDPLVSTFTVPDGKQVTYFDRFQNDGVLTISGSGYLVGIR